MSDIKSLETELKNINSTVEGISTDFRGFGISVDEAKAAMGDQQKNIDELKAAFTALEIKMTKAGNFVATENKNVFAVPEVKKMFDEFFRKGMSVNDGPSGGYLVHPDYLNYVFEKVKDLDAMRANATVLSTTSSSLEIPVEDGEAGMTWVQETETRGETAAPTFGKVIINVNEAQAKVRITRTMRADAAFPIDNYVTSKLIDRIARGEAEAFVKGTGPAKPEGLWTNTKISSIPSGSATALTFDSMIDAVATLPWAVNSTLKFGMNKKTEAALRKIKDTSGQYIWNPSLVSGMPSTVIGYPIVRLPNAPDIAANNEPVICGDFRGYGIVDRTGVELIKDEVSASLLERNLIQYTFNTRIGGGVITPSSFVKIKVKA